MNRQKAGMISGALLLVAALAGLAVWLGRAPKTEVRFLDKVITVRLANNPFTRARGLSGTEIETLGADGMLFTFGNEEVRDFWMKDMNYPLDVIWIRDGRIVAIDFGVPAPTSGAEPAHMTSDPVPVDMVLELPAGGAFKNGLIVGSAVELVE